MSVHTLGNKMTLTLFTVPLNPTKLKLFLKYIFFSYRNMTKSIIRDLLGIKIKIFLQCKCGLENDRIVDHTHINLVYPDYRPSK